MKKISIIVPTYNEEKTVAQLLRLLKKTETPLEKEIIVVDDGSRDKTSEILKTIEGIILLSHEKNRGKGAAIRTGLGNCSGDIIVIQDADLEYHPEQIPFLVAPILRGETEVVYGSRFLNKQNKYWKIPSHYIANRILSFAATMLYKNKITDVATCYKIFTEKVKDSLRLELNDFGFDIEVTAKICKSGFSIQELPIHYNPRSFQEGKKINWKDGIMAFWYLLKFTQKKYQ